MKTKRKNKFLRILRVWCAVLLCPILSDPQLVKNISREAIRENKLSLRQTIFSSSFFPVSSKFLLCSHLNSIFLHMPFSISLLSYLLHSDLTLFSNFTGL